MAVMAPSPTRLASVCHWSLPGIARKNRKSPRGSRGRAPASISAPAGHRPRRSARRSAPGSRSRPIDSARRTCAPRAPAITLLTRLRNWSKTLQPAGRRRALTEIHVADSALSALRRMLQAARLSKCVRCRERFDPPRCFNDLLRTPCGDPAIVDADAGRHVPMPCRSARTDPREGNGVKKPSPRAAWIALLMLVVTVCVYSFAVIGAKRQQIEAVATELPEPRRHTDGPLGAAPIATTLARAERHSITETLTVTGSLVAREEIVVGAEVDGLRIVEILADVGDRVEQGQALARLDGTMLRIQLAQNTSRLAKAEATIAQVKTSIAETEAAEAEAAAV